MSSSVSLYHHVVFSTKNRIPLLSRSLRLDLYKFINNKVKELSGNVICINGYVDHIHILICIPSSISLSEYIKYIKGASSRWINKMDLYKGLLFRWQKGYFAESISKKDLNRIKKYIRSQEIKHFNPDSEFELADLESRYKNFKKRYDL
ncbi:MAG: IS200/IS605 family transposase [Saprospiraceae bacterium]|nr:IS200/IS605 family transposase [Bacteroidia bacterium]NNF21989.1 IS200/IS605 family transposase [Saprospiraceae bacterium]